MESQRLEVTNQGKATGDSKRTREIGSCCTARAPKITRLYKVQSMKFSTRMRSTEIPSETQQARNCISARIPIAASVWSFTNIDLTPNFDITPPFPSDPSIGVNPTHWWFILSHAGAELNNQVLYYTSWVDICTAGICLF